MDTYLNAFLRRYKTGGILHKFYEITARVDVEGKEYLTSERGLDNLKIISQHMACIAALRELVLELNGVMI